jgi:hypothetical protein
MAQLQEAIIAALTGGVLGAAGAANLLAKGFAIVGAPMVAKFLADIGVATASAAAAMSPYIVCAGGGILIGLAVYGTYVYFFRYCHHITSPHHHTPLLWSQACLNALVDRAGGTRERRR